MLKMPQMPSIPNLLGLHHSMLANPFCARRGDLAVALLAFGVLSSGLANAQPAFTETTPETAAETYTQPTQAEIDALNADIEAMDVMRRFGVAQAPAKPDNAIRIANYNLLNLFDWVDDPTLTGDQDDMNSAKPLHELVAVARAIRAVNADVLCLQEVESHDALVWFRDTFLDGMGYDHVASIDAGDARGIEQSILSRYPVDNLQVWPNLPLGGVHPAEYGRNENWFAGQPLLIRRSPLKADIHLPADPTNPDAGQRTLTVFVVHHKSGGPAAYWREAESKAVLGLAREVTKAHPDRAVLIVGDFNAQPRDASVKTYLEYGFNDIFAKHPQANAIVTHESGRRIDLILANDAAMAQLLANKAFVFGTAARPDGVNWRQMPTFTGMASDHYPVVVDLATLPKPQSDARDK